jgi:hypothetical protein
VSIVIDLSEMVADSPQDWDIVLDEARVAIMREFLEESH